MTKISTPQDRVNTLYKLSEAYRFKSPDSISLYAHRGLTLAREIQYEKGMAFCYKQMAVAAGLQDQYSESIIWLDSAILLVDKHNNYSAQIGLRKNKLHAYHLIGQPNKAFIYLKELLAISQKHNLRNHEAQGLRLYGQHYDWLNQYDSALHYYKQASALNQQLGKKARIGVTEYFTGAMLLKKSQYALALEKLQSALQISLEHGDTETQVFAMNDIAAICNEIGLYEKGTEVLKKLEEASLAGNEYTDRADILVNLAFNYLNNNQPDLAYTTAQKALQFNLNVVSKPSFAKTYLIAGQAALALNQEAEALTLLEKGKNSLLAPQRYEASQINNLLAKIYYRQDQFKKSLALVDENLEIKTNTIFPDILSETYRIQAELALKASDFQKAYEYRLIHQTYADSVLNLEKARALIRSSIEFDTKRNKLVLEVAQQKLTRLETQVMLEDERKRNLILLIITIVLISSTLLVWRFYRIRMTRLILEKKMQQVSLKSEKEQLRNKSLQNELDLKKKVVLSQALQLAQKNESMTELQKRIESEMKTTPSEAIKKAISYINSQVSSTKDWEVFEKSFESVYSGFFVKLKHQYHSLTPRELQLCALLRLNLSIKEMSGVLGISQEGVKKARYRIRKKIGLTDSNENLSAFLITFS